MKVRKCLGTVEMAHIVRGAVSTRCKYNVHGHSAEWFITIKSDKLTDYGMVVDFIELKKYKKLIDIFDHCMVLWNDESKDFTDFFKGNFKRVVIMEKNTTAENFARFLFKVIANDLNNTNPHLSVDNVEYFETKSSEAIADDYDNDDNIYWISPELENELIENGIFELVSNSMKGRN